MPMPFDSAFESAVEEAVDFYWNEWEEYQSDRDGLIDHAKKAYYRRYFPEKFAGFQKMFSEGAVQSIADLEAIANDTSKMPAERDAARNKMYDLKKPSRGTKLAEAPEGTYYIKVAVRDAKRALEIIKDNPAYSKAVDINGSDTYYFTNPELAYDLEMDFGTQNIEVIDSNIDMNEAVVNEGQFSWFTQDSNQQIGSEKENTLRVVYMIDDKGKKYAESNYEGYGEFGGMDYYELLDVMNGGSGDRSHGISIAFNEDPTHTEPVKFPALVTDPNFNWQAHDFTKEPKNDPNQSWYTGDREEDYDDEDEYENNEGKHETELVQDPTSKEFTRKMKMTPKDMATIEKVQGMMAKEKSLKKEEEDYAQNDTAVDITGKAYSIGDIIEFRGHKFECQIGQRGIVVLQKVDDELNPLPQFFEGGTPQFSTILKNAKIVSRGMGISEGGVNPEGDAMVLNFLKRLSKIWDIPMAHAVNFINASIKRQGY